MKRGVDTDFEVYKFTYISYVLGMGFFGAFNEQQSNAPNASKVFSFTQGGKAFYRGPLLLYCDNYTKTLIDNDVWGAPIWQGLLTGGGIGVCDTLIESPIQRYNEITKNGNFKGNAWDFLKKTYFSQDSVNSKERISGLMQELYKGASFQQLSINIAFFCAKNWMDKIAEPYTCNYTSGVFLFTTLGPAVVAASVGVSSDLLKTNIRALVSKEKKGVIEQFVEALKAGGWKHHKARFITIFTGYTMTAAMFKLFDALSRNNPPPSPPSLSKVILLSNTSGVQEESHKKSLLINFESRSKKLSQSTDPHSEVELNHSPEVQELTNRFKAMDL